MLQSCWLIPFAKSNRLCMCARCGPPRDARAAPSLTSGARRPGSHFVEVDLVGWGAVRLPPRRPMPQVKSSIASESIPGSQTQIPQRPTNSTSPPAPQDQPLRPSASRSSSGGSVCKGRLIGGLILALALAADFEPGAPVTGAETPVPRAPFPDPNGWLPNLLQWPEEAQRTGSLG